MLTLLRFPQYDIPVLHLSKSSSFESLAGRTTGVLREGRVMKHRIDKEKLEAFVRAWTAQLNQEGQDGMDTKEGH